MPRLFQMMAGCLVAIVLLAGCANVPKASSDRASEILIKDGTNGRVTVTHVTRSPFQAYDDAIVETVNRRWCELLDTHQFKQDRTGLVIVGFHLGANGDISDMAIQKSEVGDELAQCCVKAIKGVAPFQPWPPGMGRMVGLDYRQITFTFTYQ